MSEQPNQSQQHSTHQSRADIEADRAITAVRFIFALIGGTITLAARSSGASWVYVGSVLVIIALVTGATSALPTFLRQSRLPSRVANLVLQSLDTIAALGLVYLLSDVAPYASWVLITIPLMTSSLRLGAFGVFVIWFTSSAGYLSLLWFDLAEPGRTSLSTGLVFVRPGVLLAVAACVAVLTRCLHDGWTHQALIAEQAETRLRYVTVLESLGPNLQAVRSQEVVGIAIQAIPDLDFEAATITAEAIVTHKSGNPDLLPAFDVPDPPDPNVAEVTDWKGSDGTTINSVSTIEPISGVTITAWSRRQIVAAKVESFVALVNLTSRHLDLAQLLESARYEANHDPLTGLANRASLNRNLEDVCATHQPLALFFLDLDKFKYINDTHGHDVGDDVLQFVSERLASLVGDTGHVARFGGDEFVIALAGRHADGAEHLADLIHQSVDTTIEIKGTRVNVGTSIGIGTTVGPAIASDLLRAADEAVFDAKEAGRGTTRIRSVEQNPAQPDTTADVNSNAEASIA